MYAAVMAGAKQRLLAGVVGERGVGRGVADGISHINFFSQFFITSASNALSNSV